MITQIFKNPRAKRETYKTHTTYPTVYTPPPTNTSTSTPLALPPVVPLATVAVRAAKIGISSEEWQRRDAIVRREAVRARSVWTFMDNVYPYSIEEYQKMGVCSYMGCVYSYMEIDSSDWPEDDDVFAFNIRPINPRSEEYSGLMICNFAYMRKEPPTQ
jgi:hypothetical protein